MGQLVMEKWDNANTMRKTRPTKRETSKSKEGNETRKGKNWVRLLLNQA